MNPRDFRDELIQIWQAAQANDSPHLAWIVNHEQWFWIKQIQDGAGRHHWQQSMYHNAGVLLGYPVIIDNTTKRVHMAITEFENGTEKLSAREKRHESCDDPGA